MSRLPSSNKRRAADAPPEPKASKRAKASPVTKAAPASKATSKAPASAPKPKARARSGVQNAAPTKKQRVWVFGEGSAGELGLGSSNAQDVAVPRVNPNLEGVVNIAAGGMHGAALTADNKVLTWGVNDHCALGRDTNWDGGMRDMADAKDSDSEDEGDLNPREATPTAIPASSFPPGTEIVQVAAGDSTTFMLTREGLVYGCGTFRDSNGVYGFTLDPKTDEIIKIQAKPALVPNLTKITSLSVGADYALALDSQGRVYAWGAGQQNQLGRRLVDRRRHKALIPERVELPKSHKFVSIHAASDHAFAVDANGDTWAWGLNNFAQTGIAAAAGEESAIVAAPRRVPALAGKSMETIHGGRHHSIGVTKDGDCLVWGRLDGGQMGIDSADLPLDNESKVQLDERGRPRILLEPTALKLPRCTYATAGSDHSFAITAEGKAYSWGFNVNYQCGQGTSDDILVAKLMNGKAIREVKLCWAGAGGQYGMVAAYQEDAAPRVNGV